MRPGGDKLQQVPVWDLPVRVFHWAIVVLVGASWFTQEMEWMALHFLCGYTMIALLLFRLAWGFVGSDTARFARFLKNPLSALRYLAKFHRREPDLQIGHNAAGGWMIVAILLLLAVQAGTGLCANDDVSSEGPLAHIVGKQWSDFLSHIHSVNFVLIEIAIVLHIAAIGAYGLLKRQNLLRPMMTGRKRLPAGTQAPRMASPALAAVLLLVAGGLVAFGVRLLSP
jgi:cytochrome b